jgi:hypothetical protein
MEEKQEASLVSMASHLIGQCSEMLFHGMKIQDLWAGSLVNENMAVSFVSK